MASLKVLVTGATAFTGGAHARRLVSDGMNVTAFVRPSSRVEPLRRLGIDCRVVDITDRDEVQRAFEPFDRVFHIEALYRTEAADRKSTRLNSSHSQTSYGVFCLKKKTSEL